MKRLSPCAQSVYSTLQQHDSVSALLINASQRLQKCQASPVRLSLFPWKVTQNSCLPAKKKNEYSTQCTKGCLNLSSTSNIVRQPRITSSINALFWEHLNTIWQKPNLFFFFFFCLPPIAATDKQTKYLRMIPWDTLRVHLGLLSTFFVWPHPAKVLRSSDAFQLTQACEARFFLLSKSSPVFTLSTF